MVALDPNKSYRKFRWLFAMKQKGLSNQGIADICGVARCTIDRWAIRLNIRKYIQMDRNSDIYREWRNKVFGRDGFRCVKCGTRSGIQAHHKKPWSTDPKMRFLVSNGETLCEGCHSNIHPWMKTLYEARTR